MKKVIILFAFIISFVFFNSSEAQSLGEHLKYMPVQDGGRLKPFDTFSREMLELVYGRQKFKFDLPGEKGRSVEAYIVVMTWMLSPEAWQNRPMFEVKNHQVKKVLGLNNETKYFKGEALFNNDKFILLRQELDEKRQSKEKLTPYFQALQRLENQFFVFREIASGKLLRVLPPKANESSGHASSSSWFSVADLPVEAQQPFLNMTKNFASYLGTMAQGSEERKIENQEQISELAAKLDKSVDEFAAFARAYNPTEYEASQKVGLEVSYNSIHPFRWAYSAYILAAVFFLLVWIMDRSVFAKLGWVLVAIGFLLHTIGFGVRIYLADRPPVTNMYETVVWVAWGALIFAFVIQRVYKFKFVMLVGALMSTVCLVIADTAPAVLDPSIQPLEAVLRSNYWLIVHVMTITISYAAFMLALGLGNMSLVYFLKGEIINKEKIRDVTMATYRAIQIGVAFLAPGIILGGIWADYSWGRFWGWDPKETWALIALLGYLAVLHGRLGGLIKDFGMAAASIIAFSLVVMAWYGVNFVLGAGLHSYGFGAGGVEYVSAVIAAQILFVIYVHIYRRGKITSIKS